MPYTLPVLESVPTPLSTGNTKLGSAIYVWSLPALLTCPGHTALCAHLCYALKGRFAMAKYLWRVLQNWLIAALPWFASRMVAKIAAANANVVRIHVSGDFFSAAYVRQWQRIAEALPTVRFYAYTRSWRVPEIRRELIVLSRMPNIRLWYSYDAESGEPVLTGREDRVRLAYLSTSHDDRPEHADLVFRDYPIRGVVVKRINGALVCPAENGTGVDMPCDRCGFCWRKSKWPRNDKGAIARV